MLFLPSDKIYDQYTWANVDPINKTASGEKPQNGFIWEIPGLAAKLSDKGPSLLTLYFSWCRNKVAVSKQVFLTTCLLFFPSLFFHYCVSIPSSTSTLKHKQTHCSVSSACPPFLSPTRLFPALSTLAFCLLSALSITRWHTACLVSVFSAVHLCLCANNPVLYTACVAHS